MSSMNRKDITTLYDVAELSRGHRIFSSEKKKTPSYQTGVVAVVLEWNAPILGQCFIFSLDFLCFIKGGVGGERNAVKSFS